MVLSYFILSRLIFDSAIWRHSPDILKLFIYLIGTARHSSTPKIYPSVTVQRGELVTSLDRIAEANEYMEGGRIRRWSRQKVGRMLRSLGEERYIDVLADTYGTHIKIINYNIYQDPNTYKADTHGTHLRQSRNGPVTGVDTNNKGNNGKHGNRVKNGERQPAHFVKPTTTELVDYMCNEEVKNHIPRNTAEDEAEKFMNYYNSNGWKVGRNPMRDWKASVRNWLINVKPNNPKVDIYKNPGEDQYSTIKSNKLEV